MDREIVAQKLESLRRCIARIDTSAPAAIQTNGNQANNALRPVGAQLRCANSVRTNGTIAPAPVGAQLRWANSASNTSIRAASCAPTANGCTLPLCPTTDIAQA